MYIKMEIDGCRNCPYSNDVNNRSTDGFDYIWDIKCAIDQEIKHRFVERISEDFVPKHCPIKIEEV